uniref:A-kinase anchor protein 7 RI-RII subunit-binding domain-containing protein n=3 Tax=Sus scrofa TaxID=9823 RepID=A0A4X1UW82_PIG
MATCFPESQSRSGRSGGVGLEPGEVEPFCSLQPVPPPPPLSLRRSPRILCIGSSCSACSSGSAAGKRQGVLADRGVNCSRSLGSPGRTPGRRENTGTMGQLCCFPFSREEEKISELESPSSVALQKYRKDVPCWPSGDKNGGEPDDAELVRLSKRLVENAVLKAVQQYLEETQNKNKPGDGSSVKTEEADRNGTDSDNNRK